MTDSDAHSYTTSSPFVGYQHQKVPDLTAPLTEETHLLTRFFLDQRDKALRAGYHKRADRLLQVAWEAYFQGK